MFNTSLSVQNVQLPEKPVNNVQNYNNRVSFRTNSDTDTFYSSSKIFTEKKSFTDNIKEKILKIVDILPFDIQLFARKRTSQTTEPIAARTEPPQSIVRSNNEILEELELYTDLKNPSEDEKKQYAELLIENAKYEKTQETQKLLDEIKNEINIDKKLPAETINKKVDDFIKKESNRILNNDNVHKNKDDAVYRSNRMMEIINNKDINDMDNLEQSYYEQLNNENGLNTLDKKLFDHNGEYSKFKLGYEQYNKVLKDYSNKQIPYDKMPEFINTLSYVLKTCENIEKTHTDINQAQVNLNEKIINLCPKNTEFIKGLPASGNIDTHVKTGEIDTNTGMLVGGHCEEFIESLSTQELGDIVKIPEKENRKGQHAKTTIEDIFYDNNGKVKEIHLKTELYDEDRYGNLIKRYEKNADGNVILTKDEKGNDVPIHAVRYNVIKHNSDKDKFQQYNVYFCKGEDAYTDFQNSVLTAEEETQAKNRAMKNFNFQTTELEKEKMINKEIELMTDRKRMKLASDNNDIKINKKTVMTENVIDQIKDKINKGEIEIIKVKLNANKEKEMFAVCDNQDEIHYFETKTNDERDYNTNTTTRKVSTFYPISNESINQGIEKYFKYMYSAKDIDWS